MMGLHPCSVKENYLDEQNFKNWIKIEKYRLKVQTKFERGSRYICKRQWKKQIFL
jgi:hypothetical protein